MCTAPQKFLKRKKTGPPAPCVHLKTKSISVMASGRKISWGIYSLLIIPLLYLSSLLTEALSEVWPAAPGVCGELEAGRGTHQALAWASPKNRFPPQLQSFQPPRHLSPGGKSTSGRGSRWGRGIGKSLTETLGGDTLWTRPLSGVNCIMTSPKSEIGFKGHRLGKLWWG